MLKALNQPRHSRATRGQKQMGARPLAFWALRIAPARRSTRADTRASSNQASMHRFLDTLQLKLDCQWL